MPVRVLSRRQCGLASLALSLIVMMSPLRSFSEPLPKPISLWPEGVPNKQADAGPERIQNNRVYNVQNPTLTPFIAPKDVANGTAVIVCPGGGYERLAIDHEGYAVARWLNSLGITAFVLKYRLKEYGQPAPLQDGLRAVRLIRQRAAEWNINPARIGIMGFSAGGHVASTVGTHFDQPDPTDPSLSKISARPDFMVLIYPVITMKEPYVHAGSRDRLLGKNPSAELIDEYSNEDHVTAETPPTFLVHGGTDHTVPTQNSVNFYLALRQANVPAELHVFVHGPHGFGLKEGLGPISRWPDLCAQWMQQIDMLPDHH